LSNENLGHGTVSCGPSYLCCMFLSRRIALFDDVYFVWSAAGIIIHTARHNIVIRRWSHERKYFVWRAGIIMDTAGHNIVIQRWSRERVIMITSSGRAGSSGRVVMGEEAILPRAKWKPFGTCYNETFLAGIIIRVWDGAAGRGRHARAGCA
jgi:hypothetical protein